MTVPERFPYDQIEAWIAGRLPGWRWVDAVPSGMDTKTGALCCKVEGQVGPTKWERKYVWLFPDGSIQSALPPEDGAPNGCEVDPFSSRVCELGTKSCLKRHG